MKTFLQKISICFFTVLLLAPCRLGSQVFINEIQSSNDKTLSDAYGTSSDWIELYNAGTSAVDLSGWGLSDKASKPFKWTFPEGALVPAQGHLLVFANGKEPLKVSAREPNTIEGLRLWLRGDDALSAYGNGGKVTKWADASGFGNHATNATYRPNVVSGAVNGHAAVKFVHSSQQMLFLPTTTFQGMSSLSNSTVFIVNKWSGTSTSVGLFGQWKSSDSTPNCHFEVKSGGVLRLRIADVDLESISGILTQGQWSTVAGVSDMSRESRYVSIFKDGRQILSREGSVGTTSFSRADRLYIGNSCDIPTGSSQRGYDGEIAEVLLFNRALTVDERMGIERYLANKYGTAGAASQLQANFSLSGSGETLVLTQPQGVVEDSVTFTRVPCDTSWGRTRDGADTFGWFATPTPNAANAGTVSDAPLAPVEFNPPRGVYTSSLMVRLSHPDPQATIYYTRDHSEPSATNGLRYAGNPILVTKSTFIRATAVKTGTLPSRNVMTHSYLFLEDAAKNPGIPNGFPSTWSANGTSKASYGVSASIVNSDVQKANLVRAIASAPIVSVVLPDADLFGSTAGVYTHPTAEGLEAAASCEWFTTNGTGRLQIDCGFRAQGAASRNFGGQPKKSFRLCFRGRYGNGSLATSILDAAGCPTADFSTLILRAEYNNSWTHADATQRTRGSFVRDQFVRDIFREMGQPGAYGTEVHLFLNGYYWGLYNLCERPDAEYAVTYYGGTKDEWDVIKSKAEVRDGEKLAWNIMYTVSSGTLSTAAGYGQLTNLLDVVNFADYMLLNHWAGNQDWPGNNWVAMRRRMNGEKFRFCVWDAERTLENVSDNRLGAYDEHPGALHKRLLASSAYKQLYARRARRHLHVRHGVLAPTNTCARWERLCVAVAPSVFGEAARWGNYRREAGDTTTIYGVSTWEAERIRVRQTYLPQRSNEFIAKLRNAGLWTDPDPNEVAVFSPSGKDNWDNDDNWSTSVYPDLPGARARINAPDPTNGVDTAKGWRNVRLKNHDVIVGELAFVNGESINRVCNKDDVVSGCNYGLVFDSGSPSKAAVLSVQDTSGCGYTIFENDYPTRLASDLRVVVTNPEGSPEYGALRLQKTWEGPGAFIKEGPGRCSLTGAGKNWTGGTRVREGLLSATGKSFPSGTVTLETGARFLVSGATMRDLPDYRSRFVLDDPAGRTDRLRLWVRATGEGLLFSALAAEPGTLLILK